MQIFTTADDNFRHLLAALLASIVSNNHAQLTDIELVILDVGLKENTRSRFRHWAKEVGLTLVIKPITEASFHQYISGNYHLPDKLAKYAAILAPDLANDSSKHILCLDADILNTRAIPPLDSALPDGEPIGAVRDIAFPRFDSYNVMNYEDHGLPADSPYLNSGVVIIDCDVWRRRNIPAKVLDVVYQNRTKKRFNDQYAYNVLFHGEWKLLDRSWNQIGLAIDEATIFRHFADKKPTNYHPNPINDQGIFFRYIDESPYAGWRPSKFYANCRSGMKFIRNRLGPFKRHIFQRP